MQALDIARKGLDTILPPRCPVTGESVDYQGAFSGIAWRSINFIAAPYCQCCGMPFSFDRHEDAENQEGDGLCMRCIEKAPLYNSARASFIYDDASRSLILGFKHGDKMHLVQNFAPWLQSAGREFLPKADALVSVPLLHSRLRARRYNQAAILAKGLERIAGIKSYPDVLIRTRATPSQGHLSTDERHKNVRKAFALKEKYKALIKGKTLILIDDVYTTGATVNECTKILKSSGAKAVHILTLARVVKDDF
jgi:ComF family protein